MPFLPDAWRPPLHFIHHPIGEYRAYKCGDERFKVLRGSRENGRAERPLIHHPNGRKSQWFGDVVFGEDNFVWFGGWTSERILNRDDSIWKIFGRPKGAQQSKIVYDGEWRQQ